MAGRSKVELFEQIRVARRDDPSVSVRELARRFSTHRRMVHLALASPVPPRRKVQERASSVMDQIGQLINPTLAKVKRPSAPVVRSTSAIQPIGHVVAGGG